MGETDVVKLGVTDTTLLTLADELTLVDAVTDSEMQDVTLTRGLGDVDAVTLLLRLVRGEKLRELSGVIVSEVESVANVVAIGDTLAFIPDGEG